MDGEELRDLILKSKKPMVFRNWLKTWPMFHWPLSKWLDTFVADSVHTLPYRTNQNTCSMEPQWESSCKTVQWSASKFVEHSLLTDTEFWSYFDYKECSHWAERIPEDMVVPWSILGFPEQSLNQTTAWIGSKGANTPCHMDTYGFNLVAQVIGRKQWILYPPSDEGMKVTQTRVPYEESSIYSKVNFQCGKSILDAEELTSSQPHVVTLEPGDMLYVPHKWWHYVEHLTTSVSLNTWLRVHDIENFHSYVNEFLVQHIMTKFTSAPDCLSREVYKQLLNPNEWPMLATSNLDESHFEILRQVLIKNSKYFMPSFHGSGEEKYSVATNMEKSYEDPLLKPLSKGILKDEQSNTCKSQKDVVQLYENPAEQSSSTEKYSQDFLTKPVMNKILKDEQNNRCSQKYVVKCSEKLVEQNRTRSMKPSQLIDIQNLSPMPREEFVDFCRNKCACLKPLVNTNTTSDSEEVISTRLKRPIPAEVRGNEAKRKKIDVETKANVNVEVAENEVKKKKINVEIKANVNVEGAENEVQKKKIDVENKASVNVEETHEVAKEKREDSLDDRFIIYPDYLVRAFTHSDVIDLVREKLFEEIKSGYSVYKRH